MLLLPLLPLPRDASKRSALQQAGASSPQAILLVSKAVAPILKDNLIKLDITLAILLDRA